MEQISAFVGALVATYGLSRIAFRLLRDRLTRMSRLLVAHAGSLSLLILVVGFWKNSFVAFAVSETIVFIVPQIFWLVIDWLRGKAER